MVSFRYISGVCKQNKTTLSVAQDGPKIKLQSLFISSQIFMDFILQIYISQGSAATQLTSGGMFDNDFLPARRYAARVFARATCPSVRLSVCHEPVLCQNEENVMISSPPGEEIMTHDLGFLMPNFIPTFWGFPRAGPHVGGVGKFSHFLA